MKIKPASLKKNKLIAAGALAGGVLSMFFTLTSGKFAVKVPTYEVIKVIDGDTFITREKQYIRLASIDAPEIDQCGGKEAKAALEKLVIGKPVYLKVLYFDSYKRLSSLVYAGSDNVTTKMLEGGYGQVHNRTKLEENEQFSAAAKKARNGKKGIYGNKCTQTENPENPKCNIKGNNDSLGKIYFTSDCPSYGRTVVQLFKGDRWFCSETEAKWAGFRKFHYCPS